MKKSIRRDHMIYESVKTLMKKYADDIRETFHLEGWIGEKGTTTLKWFVYYEAEQGEGEGWLIDYGITVDELRSDTRILAAYLTDPDVNHLLDEKRYEKGLGWVCSIPSEYKKSNLGLLFAWYSGESNVLPLDGCELENYCDSYVDYESDKY